MKSKNIGQTNPKAKLNEEQVKTILNMQNSRQKDLALQFNVSRSTIAMIRSGRTWKHVSRKIVES